MPRGVYKRTPENTRRKKGIADRFWEKVDVKGPDECWPWTASVGGPVRRNGKESTHRYPQIWWDGRVWKAHRLSWVLAHGDIDPALDCCHRCDNVMCVNPAHLFLGTAKDNAIDMGDKRRQYRQKWTHCPHGHEFTVENTRWRLQDGRQRRYCRACQRRRAREAYLRRKNKR